jgi:hypothetical protein
MREGMKGGEEKVRWTESGGTLLKPLYVFIRSSVHYYTRHYYILSVPSFIQPVPSQNPRSDTRQIPHLGGHLSLVRLKRAANGVTRKAIVEKSNRGIGMN